MPNIIICDTSILILLNKIGELDLLQKVYGKLITTNEVAKEFIHPLPPWIIVEDVIDKKYQIFLETQIDKGEASAIALASNYTSCLLLLDDLKARKLARILNLKFTGTLGVINRAKELSVIEKIKPLIDKLLATDFRISENIIKEILEINNE